MLRLIWQELMTPSGQVGPLSAEYALGASGVWHAVLGAAAVSLLGWAGAAGAIVLAAVYWLAKEWRDLRRGGSLADGIEDALWLGLGAYAYDGTWAFPVVVGLMGGLHMFLAAWGATHGQD